MKCLLNAAENVIQPTDDDSELMHIAMKAMSTKPEDRYPTVQEFQKRIREYQEHAESIALCQEGKKKLSQARKGGSYDQYARTVYAFEEAFNLWDGNKAARKGLAKARLAYAEAALERGDLDLAASPLDGEDKKQAELLDRVSAARAQREKRQKRLRLMTHLSIAAGVLLVIMSLWVEKGIEVVRTMPTLKSVGADRANLMEAKAFWRWYDKEAAPVLAFKIAFREANPGFAWIQQGEFISEDGFVVNLYMQGKHERGPFIKDLSPLQGHQLRNLRLNGVVNLVDLSPLRGMPLENLTLYGCHSLSDLSPLHGLPLRKLVLTTDSRRVPVKEFSPLRGLPLEYISLYRFETVDLSVLQESPLKRP